MGRHASGKNNYALSGNLIIAIVVILALVAGLVWWFWLRSDNEQQAADAAGDCIEGELTLAVAEEEPGLAEQLIADFAGSDPVVRDHCVTPVVTDDLSQAAVYVAAGDPEPAIEQAGRSSTGDATTIQSPVGVATNNGTATPAAAEVAYPVASHEDAAVVAATALTEDPQAAADLLQRDQELTLADAVDREVELIAITEDELPAGYEFTGLDAAIEYQAVALTNTDEVSEEQTRAGDAMVRFAEDTYRDAGENAVNPDEVAAVREAYRAGPAEEAPETPTAEPEAPEEDTEDIAAPAEPADTLFLLDTSTQMNADFGDRSKFESGAAAITQAAPRLGETGRASSLWNYSSPINPGVTEGHRKNLGFGRGTAVAESVQLLGTGGVPLTRSAVSAALQNAADRAAEINGPVRVVLFTAGTADDLSDEQFQTALDNAPGNVELIAFHLGDGQVDPLLGATQIGSHDELVTAVNEAIGI